MNVAIANYYNACIYSISTLFITIYADQKFTSQQFVRRTTVKYKILIKFAIILMWVYP